MQEAEPKGKCLARVRGRSRDEVRFCGQPVHREDLCRRHHRKHEMFRTTTRED